MGTLLLCLLLLCPSLSPLLASPISHIINFPSTKHTDSNSTANSTMQFEAIYQFGDSLSDTGNLVREGHAGASTAYARLPYGQTFFHHPTGRASDGLLMVDYIARYFGLPMLNPYLGNVSHFKHGVNFAVAGATALDADSLATRNVSCRLTNSSLNIQLNWFKTHLNSVCSDPTECKQKLEKALILMGEIGGNDYNFAFLQGRTMKEVFQIVPLVVQTIKSAVQEVIELGAVNVVVPGNFAIGCIPLYLVLFRTNKTQMYDELECLREYNMFSKYHNGQLQQAIKELQQEYPNVAIAYGDYYAAMSWLVRHAPDLGFGREGSRRTCCSIGHNPYNFDMRRTCGSPGVPVCLDPSKRVSWDGIHMTQQANKYVANWLLTHFVPQLRQPTILA